MLKMKRKAEIKKLDIKAVQLTPLEIHTEIELRAFTNMLIDRIIEDRANGYYIDKKRC